MQPNSSRGNAESLAFPQMDDFNFRQKMSYYLVSVRGYKAESAGNIIRHLVNFANYISDEKGSNQPSAVLLTQATLQDQSKYLEHLIGARSLHYSRCAATALRRLYESGLLEGAAIEPDRITVPIPLAPKLFSFEIVSDWINNTTYSSSMQASARSVAKKLFHEIAKSTDLPLAEKDEIAGYHRIKDFIRQNNVPPAPDNYLKLNRYSITELFCLRTEEFVNQFLHSELRSFSEKYGDNQRVIGGYVRREAYYIRNFVNFTNQLNFTACRLDQIRTPSADPKSFDVPIFYDWLNDSGLARNTQNSAKAVARKLFIFIARESGREINQTDESQGYERLQNFITCHNTVPTPDSYIKLSNYSITESFSLFAEKYVPEFLAHERAAFQAEFSDDPEYAKKSLQRTAYFVRKLVGFANTHKLTSLSPKKVLTPDSQRKNL